MLQAVTAYDRYHEIAGITGISKTHDYQYIINDESPTWDIKPYERWLAHKNDDAAKDYLLSMLVSVCAKFRYPPDNVETGLTSFWKTASAATTFKPEEEIELRVQMAPKSIRNITLHIIARSKATPNPILL
jgi:hypothetical protein